MRASLDGARRRHDDQIENLSDVIEADDARQSFAKNFVSKGMKILLSQGLKPLPCRSDQGVFDYFDNAIT